MKRGPHSSFQVFKFSSFTICAALLICANFSLAQKPITNDSILEERTEEIAAVLRCPVCQGLSIQDSPTELSVQMKSVVREQLRAGKSPEEVKAYFVSKYGEWILLEPKPAGMNWMIYLAPFFILIVGGALIVHSVRKWTHKPMNVGAAELQEEAEEEALSP